MEGSGRSRPAGLCDCRVPACLFAYFAAVPKDKVSVVPMDARIGVLMEAALLFRPAAHVEAEELAEAAKPERIK